jgi:hypothetical protein
MQTFLPYVSFSECAKALDYRRLGKQRVECKQLINVIEAWHLNQKAGLSPAKKVAWINHPAAVMWRQNLDALKIYANTMISEWKSRGYVNNMPLYDTPNVCKVAFPSWLGDDRIHLNHQSNLLRKDPQYYSKFNWDVEKDLPYWWPGMSN